MLAVIVKLPPANEVLRVLAVRVGARTLIVFELEKRP